MEVEQIGEREGVAGGTLQKAEGSQVEDMVVLTILLLVELVVDVLQASEEVSNS